MKTFKKSRNLSFLLLGLILVVSCSNDDDNTTILEPLNIVQPAQSVDDLRLLVDAVIQAGLVDALSATGDKTVLAPTNLAFTNFLAANNFPTLADVPNDLLREVLLNHVIGGVELAAADLISLEEGYASTEATGAGDNKMSIYFNTTGGVVTFNDISDVILPNVEATNGIIHVVDAVIGLPTLVDHAIANPNLTSLVSALTTDGNTTFTDLLSTTGDFTVFAPINDAFTAFTNPASNALNDILLNHVIVGATTISVDLSNSYENTAATFGDTDNNLSLYINTDDGVTLNGTSNVIIPDIIASNGVIHAVDTVIDIPTVVTFAIADPTFSTLETALTSLTPATDFASVLSSANGTAPAPFTVFAPTDAAFSDITIPTEEATLTSILQHHVIAGLNVTSGDLNNPGNTLAPSLEGDNLTVTLPGTGNHIANLTDGSGNSDIGIIFVDVQAGNGVIHVINKVAIPDLTN